MRTVQNIIEDCRSPTLDEEKLGKLLRELEEKGYNVVSEWIDSRSMWDVQIFPGNDLTYCGEGKTLVEALASALDDWFADYDCE